LEQAQLLDKNKFQTVKVDYDTLVWENGVDFAPEYLHEKVKTKEHKSKDAFPKVAKTGLGRQ
jgi:hypothetical protein